MQSTDDMQLTAIAVVRLTSTVRVKVPDIFNKIKRQEISDQVFGSLYSENNTSTHFQAWARRDIAAITMMGGRVKPRGCK